MSDVPPPTTDDRANGINQGLESATDHNAIVVLIWRHRRTAPSWIAKCPTCGRVGTIQDDHADAQAIADRHYEIGGFERSSHAES